MLIRTTLWGAALAAIACLAMGSSGISSAADPATLSPELLAGKSLYEVNCSSCHGDAGRGDGTAAKSLSAPLKAFSPSLKARKDAELMELIAAGKGQMPGWGHVLKAEEMQSLLLYVHHLAVQKAPARGKH